MNLRFLYSFLLVILLSACSQGMKNHVTRFHELPMPNGDSIEVISMDPSLQQSIEFGAYAEMIGRKLGTHGYTPPEDGRSTYVAEIAYHVQPLQGAVVEQRSPFSVGVGVGSGSRGSSIGMGVSTAFGSNNPRTEYVSTLNMNIVRLSDAKRVYEGRVENKGRNPNLQQVMPHLVNALFENFPGESGTSNTVTVEQ